ncbi:hypothetical protein NL676_013785 [Syzygium grande]|nr:hypothetical protein NL676_013785 [Syzygium grande]
MDVIIFIDSRHTILSPKRRSLAPFGPLPPSASKTPEETSLSLSTYCSPASALPTAPQALAMADAGVESNPLLQDFEFPFDDKHVCLGMHALLKKLESDLEELARMVEPSWPKLAVEEDCG